MSGRAEVIPVSTWYGERPDDKGRGDGKQKVCV